MHRQNIKIISENNICTACGACEYICPFDAISINRNSAGFLLSLVDEDKCVNCSKCIKVCPSISENECCCELENPMNGNIVNGYVGYANNTEIRRKGQSGGIITALLNYLLNEKAIKYALVNKFDENTLQPKPFLAENTQELLDCTGSFYTQTAMLQKEYMKNEEFAAVLLGCQSQAIELIAKEDKNFNRPKFIFGLVCAGQNSGKMIGDLVKYSDGDNISDFKFRDKQATGWPGEVSFLKNGNKISIPKEKRFLSKQVFEAYRCLLCYDQMNVSSDIVVGDPWGIADKHTPEGYSVFITHTQNGDELIEKAIADGIICAQKISPDLIIKGQKVNTMCLQKYSISKKYCIENNKLYPYSDKLKINTEKKFNESIQNSLYNRLVYTEGFYSLETDEDVNKAIILKKKQIMKQYSRQKKVDYIKRVVKKLIGRA